MAEAKKTTTVKSNGQRSEDKLKAVKKVTPSKTKITKEKNNGSDKKVREATPETIAKEKITSKEQTNTTDEKPVTAKAGRRSSKALKEEQEKQAKHQRKLSQAEETLVKEGKTARPKVRTAEDRLKTRGRRYQDAYKLVDKNKQYDLAEGLEVAIKTSTVKFDASVELHIRLNVDPKQADQNVRGNLVLPAGNGKTVRIAVYGDSEDVAKAKKAGAEVALGDEFLQILDSNQFDFDILIATPATMPKLGKYARVLGPKGLMPNPKSGTVTKDVVKAVAEAKAGKIEYRVDSTGIIHLSIGKVSFGVTKLSSNAKAIIVAVKTAKPSSVKGVYMASIFVATTMGPSISIKADDSL